MILTIQTFRWLEVEFNKIKIIILKIKIKKKDDNTVKGFTEEFIIKMILIKKVEN